MAVVTRCQGHRQHCAAECLALVLCTAEKKLKDVVSMISVQTVVVVVATVWVCVEHIQCQVSLWEFRACLVLVALSPPPWRHPTPALSYLPLSPPTGHPSMVMSCHLSPGTLDNTVHFSPILFFPCHGHLSSIYLCTKVSTWETVKAKAYQKYRF